MSRFTKTSTAETDSGARARDEGGAEAGVEARALSKKVIDGLDLEGMPKSESKHIEQKRKQDIYDLLWNTGLHNPIDHKKKTVLITELTLKEKSGNVNKLFVVPNIFTGDWEDNRGHSEKLLFAWIRKNRESLQSKNLIIYMNYTLCAKCCKLEDLNTLCEENEGITMKFICSQLHLIKRPSCLTRKANCKCRNTLQRKYPTSHEEGIKCLKELNKNVAVCPSNDKSLKDLDILLSRYTSDDNTTDDAVNDITEGLENMSISNQNGDYTRPNEEDHHLSRDFTKLELDHLKEFRARKDVLKSESAT